MCAYVCKYPCMHGCVCVCMCIFVRIHVHFCVYICAFLCVDCKNMSVCGLSKFSEKGPYIFSQQLYTFCIRALHMFLQCRMYKSNQKQLTHTGWRRLIGCLQLQVIFRKRANNYMALLRRMTYEHKARYVTTPPCTASLLKTTNDTKNSKIPQMSPIFRQRSPVFLKIALYFRKRALYSCKLLIMRGCGRFGFKFASSHTNPHMCVCVCICVYVCVCT